MTCKIGKSAREEILLRIGSNSATQPHQPAGSPLDWSDLGFLCQGLTLAMQPLMTATSGVTERHSLGPRGAWLLNLIAAGVVFPHELSEVFGIGRSLTSSEISRLTDAGLIDSRPGEQDRRRTELTLTDKGREELANIRGEIERIVTTALAGYSPDEVRLCARMLRDLRENSPA